MQRIAELPETNRILTDPKGLDLADDGQREFIVRALNVRRVLRVDLVPSSGAAGSRVRILLGIVTFFRAVALVS